MRYFSKLSLINICLSLKYFSYLSCKTFIGSKYTEIMKTTGNIPFNGSDYDSYSNTATSYKNGYCVSILDFDTDTFEQHDDMTNAEADAHYSDMVAERERYEDEKDYDVRSEQGFYGYGY